MFNTFRKCFRITLCLKKFEKKIGVILKWKLPPPISLYSPGSQWELIGGGNFHPRITH